MNIILIGCGGVGSWMLPLLLRLKPKLAGSPGAIILVDGDKYEEKNLERQFFDASSIGENKARALADRYDPSGALNVQVVPDWFHAGSECIQRLGPRDWIIVAVDNHPARAAALAAADRQGCSAIIAANETTDAEAYVYKSAWRGTPCDPRVYYPSILTSTADDPIRAAGGCTGEAADQRPQLVTANFTAAEFAANLLWLHCTQPESEYNTVHIQKTMLRYWSTSQYDKEHAE